MIYAQMMEELSPIYITRQLHRLGLFAFTLDTVVTLFGLDRPRAYRLVARMKEQDLITNVEKGKYLLLGFEAERVLSNLFFISTQLVEPGYISFWSALHYYGFTEQVPRTTFVATTKRKSPVTFDSHRFRYVCLQPHKFFGYRRESVGDLPVLLADEAKALLDSLDLPRYAGGLVEVAKALYNALGELNLELLVDYANRLGNKSLNSRLAYLLDIFDHPVEGLILSDSHILLDPSRPPGAIWNSRWRVNVNLTPDQLLAWRES